MTLFNDNTPYNSMTLNEKFHGHYVAIEFINHNLNRYKLLAVGDNSDNSRQELENLIYNNSQKTIDGMVMYCFKPTGDCLSDYVTIG